MNELIKRSLLIWLGLFALAFVNGAIREIGLKKFIGEPWAHHISAITAFFIFGVYVLLLWNKSKIKTSKDALFVGGMWFLLTILTETFVLNKWISKLSWEEIIQTYNFSRGELWPLVLVWIGVLPSVVRFFRGPARNL